ncbi:MAG: efflux transporter outer membrane subunit [Pseudomonadota bacterium]
MKKLFILILAILFLGGCTLAPKYTRPDAPVPPEWPAGTAYNKINSSVSVSTVPNLKWREFITDTQLQKIIEIALNNNRDLRIAALNVERARAMYGIQRFELLPSLNIVGSGSKQLIPSDLSSSGNEKITEQYSVNLGIISWEIDFFGRIRNLKDKALEQYLATEQARRSVQILIVSEVANAYLALAADLEKLKLAQSTLDNQQSIYGLIHRRYAVGLATELDLRQAQTLVDAVKVDLAQYTRQVAQDENALNLLIGSVVPGNLIPIDLSTVVPLKEISPGMSSNVLLSRPDILQAENLLKAANANIGAARATFFPRISLTTTFGTASSELSGLFKPGSGTWNFASQVILPIFDARTLPAYKVTKVEKEIMISQYEKAIQTAFREVADSLSVQGTVKEQLSAQESLVNALAETHRLSNARYTKGIDSFLSVLDAQRSLYAAQQGLVALRLLGLTNLVKLYAVLGGGA